MENYQEALAALFLMTGLVVVIFIIARYTYLIKKAMIEKGLAAQQRDRKPQYIDIGCIVIGLGLGLLTSSAFTFLDLPEDTMDLLVWGTISIFGGLSIVAAHYIRRKIGH